MATIKSFTTLEQSKKLAEILPLESADMYWWSSGKRCYIEAIDDGDFNEKEGHIRAWSLAALLEVLKQHCERLETNLRINKNYNVFASRDGFTYRSFDEYPDGISNLIDACVSIIENLHELNLL